MTPAQIILETFRSWFARQTAKTDEELAEELASALREAGFDLDHRYEQIGWRHYCMAAPGHVILFSPTCGYADCDGVPVPVFVGQETEQSVPVVEETNE